MSLNFKKIIFSILVILLGLAYSPGVSFAANDLSTFKNIRCFFDPVIFFLSTPEYCNPEIIPFVSSTTTVSSSSSRPTDTTPNASETPPSLTESEPSTPRIVADSQTRGFQGIQGPRGERGYQGIQGDRGPQGIQGPRGDSNNIDTSSFVSKSLFTGQVDAIYNSFIKRDEQFF